MLKLMPRNALFSHERFGTVKEIKLTNSNKVAYVDDSDFEQANQFSWHLNAWGYVRRYVSLSEHKSPGKKVYQLLHVFLLGKRAGRMIDHWDRDMLNNQRSNLRHATGSQNQANRKKTPGTSKYKGVFWDRGLGKWRARITVMYRGIHLGVFLLEEDAAEAYNKAAKFYFGAFATLNTIGKKCLLS